MVGWEEEIAKGRQECESCHDFGRSQKRRFPGGLPAGLRGLAGVSRGRGSLARLRRFEASADHTPVGPAGDVYALGAMLYELLAGHPPVEGDSVKDLLDQVHAGPPRALAQAAPEVPHDLDAVVAKAMARAPRDRYPTARELAADLKRFQTGQLVTAQRYGRWRLLRR